MEFGYQFQTSLLVSAVSIIVTLGLFFFSTRHEGNNSGKGDDH